MEYGWPYRWGHTMWRIWHHCRLLTRKHPSWQAHWTNQPVDISWHLSLVTSELEWWEHEKLGSSGTNRGYIKVSRHFQLLTKAVPVTTFLECQFVNNTKVQNKQKSTEPPLSHCSLMRPTGPLVELTTLSPFRFRRPTIRSLQRKIPISSMACITSATITSDSL